MTTHDLEPLDALTTSLLRAERDAPDPPPDVAARVWSRVEAAHVASAGRDAPGQAADVLESTARAVRRAGAWMGLAGGLVGLVTGAALHASLASPVVQVVTVDRPVPVVQTVAAPAPQAAAQPAPVPSTVEAPRPATPRPRAETAPAEDGMALEASGLDRARVALTRGDAAEALQLLNAQEKRFANGLMVEDRAALRVLTLAALQRTEDAASAARAFLVRYPDSLHRRAVEGALPR
jgi:hypothetical protein